MTKIKISDCKLELALGDITMQDTEAVVNAANKRLAPGGGVAGAIHRASGPELWEECKKLGGCDTGDAKITKAYNLPNKFVIHTVGPVYGSSKNDAELLKNSYLNSLKVADKNGVKSISFPALSTGAFGYPLKEAAEIALKTIIDYLKSAGTKIKLVRIVLYNDFSFTVHKNTLKEIFPTQTKK
ncbi:MAG: RNase III inhibitor [Elusimicrobia bacterium CG08_land_8_20_14_0_20_44_26]|nr:MAG: RNase III inhibitor [Elusimicrobia bacterium CG08_land_8_20_14_0_20_44_26]